MAKAGKDVEEEGMVSAPCPLWLRDKRHESESQLLDGATWWSLLTIIEVVLREHWKKLDWGHIGEKVPRGQGNSTCAQLVGVLLQKGTATCSHSWGKKWWKRGILRREAECACAGGCDSGEGQPEHRWGELCCGGKVGAEGGADKWESVEAAFRQCQSSQ